MSLVGRGPAPRWLAGTAWVLAGCVAALQIRAAFRRPQPDRLPDLRVYFGSVDALWHHGSLYDFIWQDGTAPFTYPPFAGLIFAPLSLVPFTVAAVIWTALTVAVVVALAYAVSSRAELPRVGPGLRTPIVLLVLFASAPIASNIRYGQISVFLVAAVLVDALHLVPPRWRGVATGVAGAIKLTPMIFLPYYWFSGQRRTAVVTAITFTTCTAIGWVALPADSYGFWFTKLWNVNRLGHIATGGNQSINGALLRLELPSAPRTVIAGAVGLLVVVLALHRGVAFYRQGRLLLASTVIGAAGLAFSPVSWTHHQVWLVFAALAALCAHPRHQAIWAATVLLIMIAPVTLLGAGVPVVETIAGNARMWLAIAVAAAVPLLRNKTERDDGGASGTMPP